MDIIEFLKLSAGQWFSQRTVHHLASGQLQAGKSDLKIEALESQDGAVVKLCEQYQIDPNTVQGGWRFSWDATIENNPKKDIGSTVIVPIVNPDHPSEGQLLQAPSRPSAKPLSGRYIMGDDDVLTLITESDKFYAEERLWYLMPNLRMRTSVVKQSNGITQASFCSEIRRVQ